MPFQPEIIFVVFAVLVAAGFGIAYFVNQRRIKAIREYAASLGLEFLDRPPSQLFDLFLQCDLARRGSSRHTSNVIRADNGDVQLHVFDHQYATGSGKNRKTHRFSVCLVHSSRIRVSGFEIEPENWFSKLSQMVGKHDINFEDDAEFSRAFQVRGTDEPSIREFLTPQRRRALLQWPDLYLQALPNALVVFRRGPMKVDQVQNFMKLGLEVFEVIAEPEDKA